MLPCQLLSCHLMLYLKFCSESASQRALVTVPVPVSNILYMLQVEFDKPEMTVDALIGYGRMLVDEQENVQRVQLAESYLSGAELAGIDGSSMPPELVKKIEERKKEDEEKQERNASPGLLA